MTDLFAHARHSDPLTSHKAADSVTDLSQSRHHIYAVLKYFGPMCDHQIQGQLRRHNIMMSDSGARSRRSELVKLGEVVDSGTKFQLPSGRMSIMWEVK